MKITEPPSPPARGRTVGFLYPVDVRRGDILCALVALLLLGAGMVATDPYFTFLDDEAAIIMRASKPVRETVTIFLSRGGEHEHPPLSDILLHFWLPAGRTNPRWLRLPSVFCYVAGLVTLAAAAWKLGARPAAVALLCISVLWPFGFHYGRLAGWYSPAFLLVGLVTLAYLRVLEQPTKGAWCLFAVPAVLLVHTNYYGWAVLGCLALDYVLRHRRRELPSPKALAIVLVSVFLLFTPLLGAFVEELRLASQRPWPFSFRVYAGAYNFYCLFASQSIAPWYWPLSVPVALAILLSCGVSLLLASNGGRRFLAYFALLYSVMIVFAIDFTTRLLFISPWLLLGTACALASPGRRGWRRFLVMCLGLIAAAGWFGIMTRRFYSSAYFLEPWPKVADLAARAIGEGSTVVANRPTVFFYMKYSLPDAWRSHPSPLCGRTPGWVSHPHLYTVDDWLNSGHSTTPTVLFIHSRGPTFDLNDTAAAESWLDGHCSRQEQRGLFPEPGYVWRRRYIPGGITAPFRIYISRYACPSEGTETSQ